MLDFGQRLANVERRRAAIAGDDRRHAHPNEILGPWLFDEIVGVSVNVDEAWRDDEARGVDDLASLCSGDRADGRDASCCDRHISPACRRTGAVHDLPPRNQQVIASLDLRSWSASESDKNKESGESAKNIQHSQQTTIMLHLIRHTHARTLD